jgi:hypothetical protein
MSVNSRQRSLDSRDVEMSSRKDPRDIEMRANRAADAKHMRSVRRDTEMNSRYTDIDTPGMNMRAAMHEDHYIKAAQRESREIEMRAAMQDDYYMKAAKRESREIEMRAAMHDDHYMKAAQRDADEIEMRAAMHDDHYMKAAQRNADEIEMRAAMHEERAAMREERYMKAALPDTHDEDRYMRAVKAAHEVDMTAAREHDVRMRAKAEDALLETKMQRMSAHSPFRHTSMTARNSADMHPETQFCQCHLKAKPSMR